MRLVLLNLLSASFYVMSDLSSFRWNIRLSNTTCMLGGWTPKQLQKGDHPWRVVKDKLYWFFNPFNALNCYVKIGVLWCQCKVICKQNNMGWTKKYKKHLIQTHILSTFYSNSNKKGIKNIWLKHSPSDFHLTSSLRCSQGLAPALLRLPRPFAAAVAGDHAPDASDASVACGAALKGFWSLFLMGKDMSNPTKT